MTTESTSTKPQLRYPYDCEMCTSAEEKRISHFEPTDAWDVQFPKRHLIHAHFGKATKNEAMSTAEAQWLHDHGHSFFDMYPGHKFFIIIDLHKKGDAEFISKDAMALYATLQKRPESGRIIYYGVSPAMRMLMNVLAYFGSSRHKVLYVKNKEEAGALYREWLMTEPQQQRA